MSGQRWDQLSTKARCYLLFKKIDANSRGLSKVGSAIAYLAETEYGVPGLETTSEAPELYVAFRTLLRERRNLRDALNQELKVADRENAAKRVGHA